MYKRQELRSPIDGIIEHTAAHVGDYVGPGTQFSVLTTVSNIDTLTVDVAIPMSQYLRYAGDRTSIYDNEGVLSDIRLVLADGSRYPLGGIYDYTRKDVSSTTGTLVVVVMFPNPDETLKPGQFARVEASVGPVRPRVVVPQQAVSQTQDIASVWVVEADSTVHYRRVTPGDTYGALRELSYIGAQVLHEGTIFPVREKNIPLNIRNTNAPDHPGTMILESIGDEMEEGGFITGIAGKKGFSIITIAKTGMSSEPGSLLKILNVLAKHEVNVEYLPSGIDNVSLVVSSDKVSRSLYEMLGELQKEVQPNKITVTEHIAIVAAVGRKMAYRPGVSGKIFAKLGENGVNIRMITQGPEELNIIVGVEEKDFEQAIRVLYNSFVKENVV